MIFSDNHIQYVHTLGCEFRVSKLKIKEMRATIKRYVTLGGSSIYLEPFFKIFSWELQHNNPTSFNELKKTFQNS